MDEVFPAASTALKKTVAFSVTVTPFSYSVHWPSSPIRNHAETTSVSSENSAVTTTSPFVGAVTSAPTLPTVGGSMSIPATMSETYRLSIPVAGSTAMK